MKIVKIIVFVIVNLSIVTAFLFFLFIYGPFFWGVERFRHVDYNSKIVSGNKSRVITIYPLCNKPEWYESKNIADAVCVELVFKPTVKNEMVIEDISFVLADAKGEESRYKYLLYYSGEFYTTDVGKYYADIRHGTIIRDESALIQRKTIYNDYFILGYVYDLSVVKNDTLYLRYKLRYEMNGKEYYDSGCIEFSKAYDRMDCVDCD